MYTYIYMKKERERERERGREMVMQTHTHTEHTSYLLQLKVLEFHISAKTPAHEPEDATH